MSLKEQLQADLTSAMRSQDDVVRATLRMALAAVKDEEVSGKAARELSDDEVRTVLAREAKKRREAAEAFARGGADGRAARELAEGRVLDAYLPEQLSDQDLEALVEQVVTETGAAGPRAMGQVMKAVGPRVAGRAEGGRVAAVVRAALAR